MGKHKKKKKSDKKPLPMRPPVELQFEPTIPIEILNAAVDKAVQRYKKRG
jgi:hypothetical protein